MTKEGQKRRNRLRATVGQDNTIVATIGRQPAPCSVGFRNPVLIPLYCSLLGLFRRPGWESLARFSLGLALQNPIGGKKIR